MRSIQPPFDDTVQLEDMPGDFAQSIVQDDTSDTAPIVPNEEVGYQTFPESNISTKRRYLIVGVLFYVNLLNYMDRYTIAGVLTDVKNYYTINNTDAGLLQTAFISSYMLFSPIFGFLGDRWVRKYIMATGLFFWSVLTAVCSFIGREHFAAFISLRALVGIGEASYSTIAPTIIADLFVGKVRSTMLMIFYFAIPVGSGLGYIVGSNVASAVGDWKYSLRVTPPFGVVCVILIILVVKEPPRGLSEGVTHLKNTTWLSDLLALIKNKSFMLSSFGFTCVAFVTGALALWAPTYMLDSIEAQGMKVTEAAVSLKFGIITCAAGFVGVALGSLMARRYKESNPRADPLICALGLIFCSPFLYFSLILSRFATDATWILIFLGETLLCLNWAVVADILLYVVVPTRRSTAEAFQILMSHALGDAGSPYVIGKLSDVITSQYGPAGKNNSTVTYIALQYSLLMTTFVCVIGGGSFLATALFIERDKAKAEKTTKGDDVSEAETDYSRSPSSAVI